MWREILLNKWFFSFVAGWIVFLLLVDWSTFTKNVWGGIVAVVLEVWQDSTGVNLGIFKIQDVGIPFLETTFFFTFGLVFTMGVIFMQYLPRNGKLQLAHVMVFSIGYMIFEFLMVKYGLLIHVYWNFMAAMLAIPAVMGTLAWLKNYISRTSNQEEV